MKNVFYAQVATSVSTVSTISSTELLAFMQEHIGYITSFEIFTNTKQISYKAPVITINTEEYKYKGISNVNELILIIKSNI